MTPVDPLLALFSDIDRLVEHTESFVRPWGEAGPERIDELQDCLGASLPRAFAAFINRYGNLDLGYQSILGSGPVQHAAAAVAITEQRRTELPALPADCLVICEENTDMVVIRASGTVEVRSQSSSELSVFRRFTSFEEFLRASALRAIDDGKWNGQLPDNYS